VASSVAKAALRYTVKGTAAARDVVFPPDPGLVILIYHRVGGDSKLDVDMPVSQFDEQMAWIAATGRVATLEGALDALASGTARPDGAVRTSDIVVTFDDGTADFVDHALPVLERHRIPVTLYLATAHVDEGIEFPEGGTPLSWAGVADACATGLVAIGSHTHRHRLLDRLSPAEIDDELDRSVALISEHTGRGPLDFAYPKAVPGSDVAERAVRARFRSAALAGTRPNAYGATDPYRLARSPIQVSDGQRWFVRKADGGMALEDELRRLLNRRRYAAATT
jgi:peptidoglycan/xylan/chitin deacetylase (PgdA/CDA1 family)